MLDYGQPSMYMSCLSSPHCAGRDCLIEPLHSTIQAKVKANAVKQEHKKQEELKRSSLRVMAALLTILDSGERSRGRGKGRRRRDGEGKWRRENVYVSCTSVAGNNVQSIDIHTMCKF